MHDTQVGIMVVDITARQYRPIVYEQELKFDISHHTQCSWVQTQGSGYA